MIERIRMIFIVSFLGLLQAGCGRSADTIYLENTISDTEAVTETVTEQTESEWELEQAKICYVYVCGAVVNPGVYELRENGRVYEAIALAGGLLENAGAEAINQAEMISDGQMIRVPTKEEMLALEAAGGSLGNQSDSGQDAVADERVDINTASAAELMTLPGIGKAKADAMIDYRTKNGNFSTVEEIMNVEGIKEGVYNRIKDDIRVK